MALDQGVCRHTLRQVDGSPWAAELHAYACRPDTLAIVRVGRSLGELLTMLKGLKQRGLELLSSTAGELVFHVFGSLAHSDHRLIPVPILANPMSSRPPGAEADNGILQDT